MDTRLFYSLVFLVLGLVIVITSLWIKQRKRTLNSLLAWGYLTTGLFFILVAILAIIVYYIFRGI